MSHARGQLHTLLLPLLLHGCKETVAEPTVGPEWVVFTVLNSPLPNAIVNAIHVDRQHRAWFATNDGAAMLSQKSWSVFKDSLRYLAYDNLGNNYVTSVVTAISVSKDQSVWFGLKGGGVSRYDQNSQNGHTWTRFRQPVIQYDYVNGIACDLSEASKYGEIWLTTALGVCRFVQVTEWEGTWQKLGPLPFPTSQNTVATVNPGDNSIWFGTYGDGLARISYFPTLTSSRVTIPSGAGWRINGIAFDAAQHVWVAMESGVALLDLNSGLWTQYNHDNTHGLLPVGGVKAVETDYASRRWFGTDSGIVQVSDTTWQRLTTDNSPLPDNAITALEYDNRGNLWIGTRNGAAVYNPTGTVY